MSGRVSNKAARLAIFGGVAAAYDQVIAMTSMQ